MQGHNLPHRDLWVLRVGRRWDLCDRPEAESTASHGSQWVTLATGRVVSSAWALAMQGKPALNRCTTRMSCRWGVASTCISLRCTLYMLHIMYIYIYIYLFMYSLYFITLQRSGTRPVTKPLRSIRPEHRGTFHTQFWLGTIYIYIYLNYLFSIHHSYSYLYPIYILFTIAIAIYILYLYIFIFYSPYSYTTPVLSGVLVLRGSRRGARSGAALWRRLRLAMSGCWDGDLLREKLELIECG